MLSDAEGVPLVVQTTAANVNDETQLPALLDAMPAVHRRYRGRVAGRGASPAASSATAPTAPPR